MDRVTGTKVEYEGDDAAEAQQVALTSQSTNSLAARKLPADSGHRSLWRKALTSFQLAHRLYNLTSPHILHPSQLLITKRSVPRRSYGHLTRTHTAMDNTNKVGQAITTNTPAATAVPSPRRPPRQDRSNSPFTVRPNPFDDEITSLPSRDPFSSVNNSRAPSRAPSSTATSTGRRPLSTIYFKSRRIQKDEIEKPWLEKKDPKEKWVTIIPLVALAIGFLLAGLLVYDGIRSVVHHEYCLVLSEDFSTGLDPKIWTKEAEVGGYG